MPVTSAAMQVRPGQPQPLGATLSHDGTNFAVESAPATAVDLCLLDGRGHEVSVPLTARTGDRWHGFVPGVGAGQRYGFRVHGAWAPRTGARANPSKLLLDPRARAVDGALDWDATVFDHLRGPDGAALRPLAHAERSDSAAHVPCSVVVDPAFDWDGDSPPQHALARDRHLRGPRQGPHPQHPDVPESQRGTFGAVAHPSVVEHLHALGVTAVQLLPVQHFLDEQHLVEAGLTNYWGYNTIAFCAPHPAYAAGGNGTAAVHEFKTMVKALHAAGIEVLLDVVYNHTAEGGPLGPTLAFRGLDDAGHYRLDPADATRALDTTGTGGSLDASHALVRGLILDSLRLWVSEMHVDGFRFDLATALGRNPLEFDPDAVLFEMIDQDPVLRQAKLIAEPWDVGPDGYQLGRFPVQVVRVERPVPRHRAGPLAGHPVSSTEVRSRLAGSGDLFGRQGRPVRASINFVTCHDGFTLADLVSYERKHNEANGEGNRDGTDDNRSSNGGVEGPTDDASVVAARDRRRRAMLATLYLSRGCPDAARRRRAGSDPARQQQRLLPGRSAVLARLAARRRRLPGLRATGWPGFGGRATRCSPRVWPGSRAAGRTDGRPWTASGRRPMVGRSPTDRTSEATGFCGIWVPPVPSDPDDGRSRWRSWPPTWRSAATPRHRLVASRCRSCAADWSGGSRSTRMTPTGAPADPEERSGRHRGRCWPQARWRCGSAAPSS